MLINFSVFIIEFGYNINRFKIHPTSDTNCVQNATVTEAWIDAEDEQAFLERHYELLQSSRPDKEDDISARLKKLNAGKVAYSL
jgi:hypothetical protein